MLSAFSEDATFAGGTSSFVNTVSFAGAMFLVCMVSFVNTMFAASTMFAAGMVLSADAVSLAGTAYCIHFRFCILRQIQIHEAAVVGIALPPCLLACCPG